MIRVLRAFVVAAWAHRRQKDKAGKAYVWHLVRVAWIAFGLTGDAEAAVVGLLHDYIEDIDPVTGAATIALRFGLGTARAVDVLTKVKGEKYRTYVPRVAAQGDRIVLAVKIADLLHNTDATRMGSAAQMEWWDKKELYLQALAYLAGMWAQG